MSFGSNSKTVNLSGVSTSVEPTNLDDGQYQLRAVKADFVDDSHKPKEKRYPRIQVIFESIEHSTAKDIFHAFFLPSENDTEKQANSKLYNIKEFLEVFEGDIMDEIDLSSWVGLTGYAHVVQEESDRGIQNKIKSFLAA